MQAFLGLVLALAAHPASSTNLRQLARSGKEGFFPKKIVSTALSTEEKWHKRFPQRKHVVFDPANKCKCLNWQTVYKDYAVECGVGSEMYHLAKYGLSPRKLEGEDIGFRFCLEFFQVLDNNLCVNADWTTYMGSGKAWHGQQWCYVSAECDELNGGDAVPDYVSKPLDDAIPHMKFSDKLEVSWKICKQGEDDMLRYKTPSQLVEIAKASDVRLGHLAKFAYPRAWTGTSFDEYKDVFEEVDADHNKSSTLALQQLTKKKKFSNKPGHDKLEKDLRTWIALHRPFVADSLSGQPPFEIFLGRTLWQIKQSPKARMMEAMGHYGRVQTLECVFACDVSEESLITSAGAWENSMGF